MDKTSELLIRRYFEEHSFVESNILSFNNFLDVQMQKIVQSMGEIVPTVIPPDVQEFKIKIDKIWITKPSLIEADGSKRDVYPMEARLRKLTYSAPMFLEVSTHIDGVQREAFNCEVGRLPIMLKSKYCHLNGLKREDLLSKNEDPDDPGGYFILNGNERVLITVEDLASNKLFIQENKVGPSRYSAKLFSEYGPYRISHTLEQMKDGMIYLTFTRFKRIPVISIIKALGLTRDQEVNHFISGDKQYDDIFINLYEALELKTEEDALEFIAKKIGITQAREIKIEKTRESLDRYLLPHLGVEPSDRIIKAYNLCKIIKRFFSVTKEGAEPTDKDHYSNKTLKLSGDLVAELFRVNLRILINDILYNFQRLVKRGKYTTVRNLIREKLLTSRIQSAMATGAWVGGRKGISQNMDRVNFLASLSHLQRVVSPLSATQENFEARALHPTHWGRLCCIETPEGTSIGLRKNFAILASITPETQSEDKIKKALQGAGLNIIR
ncbi:DNA-directed RNA polymerase subunit B'' [Candidatus Woesearchaeota archaeon]|nr:DNA-directed RNA polymerase subunit B'' [Candidatus Woesearchaeota archaeon]